MATHKKKLESYKVMVASIKTEVEREVQKDELDITSLKSQQRTLNDMLLPIIDTYDKIVEKETSDKLEELMMDRLALENQLRQLQINLEEVVREETFSDANGLGDGANNAMLATPNNSRPLQPSASMKLPQLELPTFDGTEPWPEFWDQFEASVHRRADIATVTKFAYLRNCLKGYALKLINNLGTTNSNYNAAIDLLKETYFDEAKARREVMRHIVSLKGPKHNINEITCFRAELEANLRQLASMGIDLEANGEFIATVVTEKLEDETYQAIQTHHSTLYPSLADVRDGLLRIMHNLSSRKVDKSKGGNHPRGASQKKQFDKPKRSAIVGIVGTNGDNPKPTKQCIFCNDAHGATRCPKYNTLQARQDRLTALKLCNKCCRLHDREQTCKLGYCRSCKKEKHHLYLCPEVLGSNISQSSYTAKSETASVNTVSASNAAALPMVTLGLVRGNTVIDHYAMLDTGAQRTFIHSDVVHRLGLRTSGQEVLTVRGFLKQDQKRTYDLVNVTVKIGRSHFRIKALVTDHMPSNLQVSGISEVTQVLKDHLPLADPRIGCDTINQLDLLIGVDYYCKIVSGQANFRGISLLKTKGGYVVLGKLPSRFISEHITQATTLVARIEANTEIDVLEPVENQVRKLWELDTIGVTEERYNPEERATEEIFLQNIKYLDGQYWVTLPWKHDKSKLPTNYNLCRSRTKQMFMKLQKSPEKLEHFQHVLQEQEKLGFIEKVQETEEPPAAHYIPMLSVVKNSTTTPLRVVYDCSAKASKNHPSLNDCLHTGPSLTENLLSSLLRFRVNSFGYVSDISKAFLRIGLQTADRDFTRFMWPKDNKLFDKNLQVYRFKSVLFGSTSSPFLLNATLKHHLEVKNEDDPYAKVISKALYVDNLQGSTKTEEELCQIYRHANDLMRSASMPLQSWNSNSEILRNLIQTDNPESKLEEQVSLLGMTWDVANDDLCIKPVTVKEVTTKRELVSEGSKLYDPLGLIAPVTIRMKMLIQSAWTTKLDWDDELPADIVERWQTIMSDAECVDDLVFPRMVCEEDTEQELHVFSDASQQAYGAVAYLVQEGCTPQLLMSRARVAPLKSRTLPQLELMGILVASQLAKYIMDTLLNIKLRSVYLWSDSEISIQWVVNNQSTITFVRNRVAQIINNVPQAKLHYVNTKDNPADLLTRGTSVEGLTNKPIWFQGPDWLGQKRSWQEQKFDTLLTCPVVMISDLPLQYTNYSSLRKLLRVTELVFKFIHKVSDGRCPKIDPLNYWVKRVQEAAFTTEQEYLKNPNDRSPPDIVRKLRLTIEGGVIRSLGRIQNAQVPHDTVCPILLPKNNHFTNLIIEDAHQVALHGGVQETLRRVREKFWIPNARQQVKSLLRKCHLCRRLEGARYPTPPSPPLPIERVVDAHPFEVTGVDYSGAITLSHKSESQRVYVCLFSCAVTRAVHLELAEDLSAETFLNVFRRFVARRSCPKIIISDNATNFKAGSKILTELSQEETIQREMQRRGTVWKFIPARSPWFGGFYERLIGIVKGCLKKLLYRRKVDLPDLHTLLAEIEARVNNRPLTYQTDDPRDSQPLTPSHLLCGRTIDLLPLREETEDYTAAVSSPIELNLRLKNLNQILNKWNDMWRAEYLTALREKYPKRKERIHSFEQSIKVGDVVIISGEGRRENWPLGRIIETYPDLSGNIRVVKLKSKLGEILRPIKLLYPLEITEDDEEIGNNTTTPEVLRTPDATGPSPVDVSSTSDAVPELRDREVHKMRRQAAQKCRDWLRTVCSADPDGV